MIVCIKTLLTLSLSSLQQSATTVQLNSSDPSFSQPISIYKLRLYKSPDSTFSQIYRETHTHHRIRLVDKGERKPKTWQFLKMGGLEKKSTNQIVGLPEHFNNNSVFQILLMSSKHRRQQETKAGKILQ